MLRWPHIAAIMLLCVVAAAEESDQDQAIMAKMRSSYDAPFAGSLILFDCAVDFDWHRHLQEFLPTVPAPLMQAASGLQAVRHRVLVDSSGATVSDIPATSDLSAIAHGQDLEDSLLAIVKGGLSAWVPFGKNVILPTGPTKYNIAHLNAGYIVQMNGPGVAATLSLANDFRISRVLGTLPQPLEFKTIFTSGPSGYLLSSLDTGQTDKVEARFSYTYQTVDHFQIPMSVTVIPESTHERWNYGLSDCKVQAGKRIQNLPVLRPQAGPH